MAMDRYSVTGWTEWKIRAKYKINLILAWNNNCMESLLHHTQRSKGYSDKINRFVDAYWLKTGGVSVDESPYTLWTQFRQQNKHIVQWLFTDYEALMVIKQMGHPTGILVLYDFIATMDSLDTLIKRAVHMDATDIKRMIPPSDNRTWEQHVLHPDFDELHHVDFEVETNFGRSAVYKTMGQPMGEPVMYDATSPHPQKCRKKQEYELLLEEHKLLSYELLNMFLALEAGLFVIKNTVVPKWRTVANNEGHAIGIKKDGSSVKPDTWVNADFSNVLTSKPYKPFKTKYPETWSFGTLSEESGVQPLAAGIMLHQLQPADVANIPFDDIVQSGTMVLNKTDLKYGNGAIATRRETLHYEGKETGWVEFKAAGEDLAYAKKQLETIVRIDGGSTDEKKTITDETWKEKKEARKKLDDRLDRYMDRVEVHHISDWMEYQRGSTQHPIVHCIGLRQAFIESGLQDYFRTALMHLQANSEAIIGRTRSVDVFAWNRTTSASPCGGNTIPQFYGKNLSHPGIRGDPVSIKDAYIEGRNGKLLLNPAIDPRFTVCRKASYGPGGGGSGRYGSFLIDNDDEEITSQYHAFTYKDPYSNDKYFYLPSRSPVAKTLKHYDK